MSGMAMPLGLLPRVNFVEAKPFKTKAAPRVRVVTYAAAAAGSASSEKKRAPRGFSKPRPVSQEMKEFLGGTSEIPRTELLKLIWAHIKEKDLQDPTNRRVIKCDDKLKKIFGQREQVGFLEIAGLISPHFKTTDTAN